MGWVECGLPRGGEPTRPWGGVGVALEPARGDRSKPRSANKRAEADETRKCGRVLSDLENEVHGLVLSGGRW